MGVLVGTRVHLLRVLRTVTSGTSLPPIPPLPTSSPPLPSWAAGALARARQTSGTLQVLTGGSHAERSAVLRGLRAAGTSAGFEVLELQAEPMDRHVPYGVVQDLIELLRPEHGDEGVATPLVGLIAMAALGPRPRDRAASVSREGATPLSDAAGALPRPEEVRAEVFELVRARSTQRPLLLTLEPGEFVDAPSLSFLAQLARELPRLPVVVVVSLREEEVDAFESWKRALASSSATFTRLLEEKTGPSPRLEVRRRLEGLPPATRRAVAAIGVAGPDGTLPILQLVLGEPAVRLEEELGPAVAAGVFWREGSRYHLYEPLWRPELEKLLPPPEVRALHGAVARALRTAHPVLAGKLLFRVAEHWGEAGVTEEAVPAVLAAGREAVRRGAHEEAERELRRALVLAQGMPGKEGRELEERALAELARALEMQGKTRAAMESYDRAIRASKARKASVEHWGGFLVRYARLATAESSSETDLEPRVREALQEAALQKLPSMEAELHATLAHRLLVRGQLEEGRKEAAIALERAERKMDPPVLARCLRMMALALFTGTAASAETVEATALLRRTLETIPPERAGPELPFALDDMASLACTGHDEASALSYGQRSVALARRNCSRGDLLLMLGNFCEHQLHAKDLDGATRTLAEIRTFADRYELPEGHSVRQQWMLSEGLLRSLAGDRAGARRVLEATVALGEKVGARDIMSQALTYLVVQAVEEKDFDAARAYLRRIEKEGLKRALYSMTRELLEAAVKEIPARGR